MAVLERWKKLELEPTRVKYRVTKDLPVRNGKVGPQFDFPTAENGQGVIYFGGSQQYEIVLPKEAKWKEKGWGKYLKEIERVELK